MVYVGGLSPATTGKFLQMPYLFLGNCLNTARREIFEMTKKKIDNSDKIFNLPIFSRPKSSLLKIAVSALSGQKGQKSRVVTIFTPNPEQIVMAKEDPSFASCLGSGDILVPDGIGLVIASRFLHQNRTTAGLTNGTTNGTTKLRGRITGIDLAIDIINLAAKTGRSVLIIGGRGYNQLLPESKPAYPELPVPVFELPENAGGLEGRIFWTPGFEQAAAPTLLEAQAVASLVSALKPAAVMVALGAPQQEMWICRQRQLLDKAGVGVAMAVGGTFDVIFGRLVRAPGWVQSLGLEWLFRLIQEPWRWRRQLRLLKFAGMVFGEFFRQRMPGRS